MRMPLAHGFKGWFTTISSLIFALTASAVIAAQPQTLPAEDSDAWELREEAGNIRVYTMDRDGSSFQAFKAEALLDAPINAVVAVMNNPKSCIEWLLNCTESYAVGKSSFHDRYVYSVNNMPWPVTDRDYVLNIHTTGNKATGEVVVNMSAAPDMQANRSNRVRVEQSDTRYRFIPEGDTTRMVWLQHTDPNGTLPGWLVNSLLIDIPLESTKKLERIAGLERYREATLVYDDDGRLMDVTTAGND
ncbi:START domain-containing protein [Marinobacter piscensis]|uniref:START domain-containing protein n=1 Tax=Marinobacter piscensis TaxID=1562308 RepID=UPI0011A88C5B|nr:START domain-containing protein [Marinobacter piscensis]